MSTNSALPATTSCTHASALPRASSLGQALQSLQRFVLQMMVLTMLWSTVLAATAALAESGTTSSDAFAARQVLLFHATAGFRHGSIDEALDAIDALGTAHGFDTTRTDQASDFNDSNLAQYDAVVFVMTTGNILDDQQQAAFERYIQAGGGYAGIHSASDTEYNWPWYGELIGAWFDSHPSQQTATLRVESDSHPSTALLDDPWVRFDEWYNFRTNPRDFVNVLISIDESSYSGGNMGDDHPMAWYHEFDGGRSWYTALGHTEASYSEADFLLHLLGGIRYAMGDAGAGSLTVGPSGQWFERQDTATPYFMVGSGGPEGFLYETDQRKQAIVTELIDHQFNALYIHSIRSFEGDGYDFEDPFIVHNDAGSGIAAGVFDNWRVFLDQLDNNGITTWFHVLDDTARPWGCELPLSQDAVDYIEALVTRFRDLNHLVWLSGEEYLMGSCSNAQDKALMSAIAAEIRRHDPIHPIGVHHNNGQAMQFGDDPVVNVFAQQICGNQAARSPQGVHDEAERGDWVYVMAECHPWHLNLLHDNNRTLIRQSAWGSATAGGYVLLYNAYECAHAGRLCSRNSAGNPAPGSDPHDPSDLILDDLARLRQFMEFARFSELEPDDSLALGDTDWVMANPALGLYLLYTLEQGQSLGVSGLGDGEHRLTWLNPLDGGTLIELQDGSTSPFAVPAGLSGEVAVFIERLNSNPPGNDAPVAVADQYSTGINQTLTVGPLQGVLSNDSDPDGDDLTAELQTSPSSGSLTLNADGSFSYTPDTNAVGTDSFSYRAFDGQLFSAVTTVSLNIIDPSQSIGVMLINAESGSDVGLMSDGQQLLIPSLGFSDFSIRSDLEPAATASIRFVLNGPINEIRVENVAPYTLFGDSNGVAAGQTLQLGSYTLLVEAYSQTSAGGQLLVSRTISFSVEMDPTAGDPIFEDGFE